MASPTCPICGKAAARRARNPAAPFCSERCKLVDLAKWLGEEYRIPAGRPGDGAAARSPGAEEDDG